MSVTLTGGITFANITFVTVTGLPAVEYLVVAGGGGGGGGTYGGSAGGGGPKSVKGRCVGISNIETSIWEPKLVKNHYKIKISMFRDF